MENKEILELIEKEQEDIAKEIDTRKEFNKNLAVLLKY